MSPSGQGVAQLAELTLLRDAPQALNLPQPPVQLVPTRENAARWLFQPQTAGLRSGLRHRGSGTGTPGFTSTL